MVILHITDSELNLFPDIPEDPKDASKIEDVHMNRIKEECF